MLFIIQQALDRYDKYVKDHPEKNEFSFVLPIEDETATEENLQEILNDNGLKDRVERCRLAKMDLTGLPESKLSFWLVNGAKIREGIDTEYIGGGTNARYPWLPKLEVWIEYGTNQEDLQYYLVHELTERYLMLGPSKLDYDQAHKKASAIELSCRKDPEKVLSILTQAIKDNNSIKES